LFFFNCEEKKGGFTTVFSILGVPAEEKGYIYQALGHNEYKKVPIKIPDGFAETKINNYLQGKLQTYYCRDKRPKPVLNGLELEVWEVKIK